MYFKNHQLYAIVAIVFLFVGALLHYVLISPTISNKVNEGYQQGRIDERESIVRFINDADSIVIKEDCMEFYNRDLGSYVLLKIDR